MVHKFVDVGDVVRIKKEDSEKIWRKVQPNQKYIVKAIIPHTGFDDETKFITQLEDSHSNIINLKINERYFDVVWTDESKPKFQIADKVISTTDTPNVSEGFIGYIVDDKMLKYSGFDYAVSSIEDPEKVEYFNEGELELLYTEKKISSDIARPVLEERKIGKVRMDLFNEGFPNAVLEIAKVMTWANQNKGYKDHDWKNLPNASKDIPAAASRHGIKQLIQKSKGIPAIDRVDEESKIVHLAHQAFNVLAELELVLTGVIK